MPRSFLDQLTQVAASVTYDDAVASAHVVGTAEAQSHLEGDLNILRTNMKDLKGTTNWFDEPDLSVQGIYNKQFIYKRHESGFDNVAVSGGSTTAFDTAIKGISGHNSGGGNSTTSGVIVDTTRAHRLYLRDSSTQDPITDGSNNEVYGRLSYVAGNYTITFYSNVSGVETAYSFSVSTNIDLAFIIFSEDFGALPWDQFLDVEFHDVAGVSGTLADDSVDVDGMSFLLNGLTTQAQVNNKLDKLGSTANGEGASGIAVEDASGYYTGTDIEALLDEIEAQLGGDTSSTYNFTEDNVLADDDAVYAALNKLDLKWGDLASSANGEGASLVGIEDAGGYTTETDVEGALQELYQLIEDVSGWDKQSETTSAPISSGTNHTLPGSMTYTPASGANLDVFYNGQLLLEGSSNDYQEVAGSPSTQIQFNFTVPTGANLTYMSRK